MQSQIKQALDHLAIQHQFVTVNSNGLLHASHLQSPLHTTVSIGKLKVSEIGEQYS